MAERCKDFCNSSSADSCEDFESTSGSSSSEDSADDDEPEMNTASRPSSFKLMMYIDLRKHFLKLTFRALALTLFHSDKRLTLETSA